MCVCEREFSIYEIMSSVQVKITQSCPAFCNPMDYTSMEFFRPEYSSGWLFPSPDHLPNPGIKLGSPALQMDSLPAELPGNSPCYLWTEMILLLTFQFKKKVHPNWKVRSKKKKFLMSSGNRDNFTSYFPIKKRGGTSKLESKK